MAHWQLPWWLLELAGGFNVDLFSFLFGSILSVAPLDLWLLAALAVVVLLFVGVFFVDLAQLAFDDDLARVSGVRTDWLNLALAVLTGATITLSMRVVGVLLIGAMLVIPVLVGLRLARGLRAAMATAVLAGVLSAVSRVDPWRSMAIYRPAALDRLDGAMAPIDPGQSLESRAPALASHG